MALKTRPTDEDPREFIAGVANDTRRADAETLLEIFERVTGEPGVMWGSSIIGFGSTGDWMRTGFSPRAQSSTLYLMDGAENHPDLLEQLGPHSTGRACLYIKRLEDVDMATLEELIERSFNHTGDSSE